MTEDAYKDWYMEQFGKLPSARLVEEFRALNGISPPREPCILCGVLHDGKCPYLGGGERRRGVWCKMTGR